VNEGVVWISSRFVDDQKHSYIADISHFGGFDKTKIRDVKL
jgi:hypothetical protein